MERFLDFLSVLLIMSNLSLLASSRMGVCIRVMVVQGFVLGLVPIIEEWQHGLTVVTVLVTAGATLIKGILFPLLLARAMRQVGVKREIEPLVGYSTSLLAGIAMLALAFWMDSRLIMPAAAVRALSGLMVPAAFFGILTGLFVTIARRKALTQIVGYMALENGIYVFGAAALPEHPWLMEMGILLDVFVGVFIMGVAIFHISREFDHIDADRLSALQDSKVSIRFMLSPKTEDEK